MTEPALNQYAAPLSQVADAPPTTAVGQLKLFSAQGRIGRLRYLAYTTGASIVYYAVLALFSFGLAGTNGFTIFSLLALGAVLWLNVIAGIKRCHDINISGWWSLTLIVPVVVLAWIFMPGSRDDNRFGPPPPRNTLSVVLLGTVMPVIFFVGILAAVAIPQYKNYTDKARAAAAAGQR